MVFFLYKLIYIQLIIYTNNMSKFQVYIHRLIDKFHRIFTAIPRYLGSYKAAIQGTYLSREGAPRRGRSTGGMFHHTQLKLQLSGTPKGRNLRVGGRGLGGCQNQYHQLLHQIDSLVKIISRIRRKSDREKLSEIWKSALL